ncbi:hypothetical protein [Sorangium sp. So ce124]|uniref:hypothetical protein n=1 Tax=Sorangium sp. So ce124 TaxID=3133280 RepID=UPI003F60A583
MKSLAGCARPALVTALVLVGCASCHGSQPAPPAASSVQASIPARVGIPEDAQPPVQLIVPDLAEFERPNAVLLPGRVFPLGWSRSGLFAYVYEPPDEACGCYFFHLIVQDLATHRITWEHRYESGEIREGDPDQLTSLQAVWRARGGMLSARLHELGIVRSNEPALRPFSTSDGGGPRVQIHTTTVGDDSPVGFAHITSYRVDITTPRGTTTIHRSGSPETPDETGTPSIGPLEVTAPGYLRSPHDTRVAVLIQETWRGWEGRPYVAKLLFAGADLNGAAH